MPHKSDSASSRVREFSSEACLEVVMGAPVTFVTGKGGVGKTTIATLLSREAFLHGERVLFISLYRDALTDHILGITDTDASKDVFKSRTHGHDVSVITPTRALVNYLASKHMGSITNRLNKTGLLEMVANIVPGMRELLVIGDIRSKAQSGKWDRIIVDSPSTGHARSLFNIGESTSVVANAGVIKHQSDAAKELLRDKNATQVVVVTLDHAMPLSECKEFLFDLEEDLHMAIKGVVINKSHVAKTKDSFGIDKNFENIFIPTFSYENKNSLRKKQNFFQRFKTSRKIPEIIGETYQMPKGVESLIVLGTGGVGKTTTAAAIALGSARNLNNVALLTIDPARRLGTALGLKDSTSRESHLDPTNMEIENIDGAKLHVFQLDTKHEFLQLLENTLSQSDFETARDNSFVSAVSNMGIVNEFMAIEAMHRLLTSKKFDLVVVDTPPSHHVFDLLEAPEAIARLTNSNVFKTLVSAGTMASITTNMALNTVFRPLRGLVGTELVNDAVEFMRTLKDVEEVFTRHSTEVVEYLASGTTSYVCVCNPSESSIEQTATLVKGMFERDFQGSQVIVNGVDLGDEHEVEEIATFAERLLRFKAKLTIIPEQELDDPFQIVEAISKKVEF